jgi:YegS/Rv2252/BmrU family lipid kinase
MMKKVQVIMHGRHEHSTLWLSNLKKWKSIAKYQISVAYTKYAGHAIQLVINSMLEKPDVLVAAGGDGTLNECVNGYMLAQANIPMTFLAMGTGNDFVKTLHQKGQWTEVHQLIEENNQEHVDIGHLQLIGLDGNPQQRYFINVTDIGLGGEVVQKIAKSKRRLGPFITYQKAIISSLIPYKQWMVEFELDDLRFKEPTLMLAMANAKWFGSGLGIAPTAHLQDGLLDIIHMGKITLLDYLQQLPKVKKMKVLKHPAIHYYRAATIKVTTAHLPIDCDGEFIGFTPLKCEIIHSRLKLLTRKKESL